jgi:hypothetical protein
MDQSREIMKHSRRNIPDPISPQNPVNKTDITPDRIQDHLEEKTSVEDIFRDENELTLHTEKDLKRKQVSRTKTNEISPEDEADI